jgi:hypothetical protein
MQLEIGKGLESHVDKAIKTMQKFNPEGAYALGGATLSVGDSRDPKFQPDASALMSPLFVGDSGWTGKDIYTPAIDAAFKANPNAAGFRHEWNFATSKWDKRWEMAPTRPTGDSGFAMDAAGPIINGSLLSPNAINWISEVFKQPLAWSDARSLVKIQQGTNPWAEVMNLAVAAYDGWGAVNAAGSADNTMSQDVEVQAGIIAQPIINIDVTYKLSVQELERAKQMQNEPPYAGQLIAEKQAYANWIMDVITDSLIYYGNAPTGNIGLFNVNAITTWTSVGSNQALATIYADGANTTKGSSAYQQLGKAVVDFLTPLQNKVSKVNIKVSPYAYNLLGLMSYSATYNPESTLKIMVENFMAGLGKSGVTPDISITPDPMLSASTGGVTNLFNTTAHDYMVITAEQIGTGPGDQSQSLLWYGMPLESFVYPIVPQQFSTQYRTLRRVSGVYAPLTTAVKVYYTYGI